jgi:RND family efflux transporter MFP subunit
VNLEGLMNATVDLRQLAVRRDAPPPPARRRQRTQVLTRYLLPGGVLLGFAAVLGFAFRDSLLSSRPVTVVPVRTTRGEVQRSGAPLFHAAGWVEPRPTPVLVAALAEGVVDKLLVVEGQAVKEGEPVAHLIDIDARLALQTAEADLRLREAEVAGAKATLASARTNFDKPVSLEAAFAEADATLAQKETERATLPAQLKSAEARCLLARQTVGGAVRAGSAISALTMQQYEGERDMSHAAVEELKSRQARIEREIAAQTQRRDALRKRLELKTEETRQLGEAEAAQKAAEARERQARVAVDTAALKLQRMVIPAPVSGRVLALVARPGMRLMGFVTGSPQEASTVVSLYDPQSVQVRVDVRFEDLLRVVPGQPVQIETPAVPGKLEGVVLRLTSQANIQKNTLEVKVAVKNPPPVLGADMLVQATFLAPTVDETKVGETEALHLLVPRQLLDAGEGGGTVWVADQAAGQARKRSVKLGAETPGELVEVTDGLNPADKLISGGREGLKDGHRITITGEDAVLGLAVRAQSTKVNRPARLQEGGKPTAKP